MEYYSAIKRNEMEVFVVRWMDLESVMPSDVGQKQIISVNRNRPVVAKGEGVGAGI